MDAVGLTKEDIEKQNEANLLSLMSNSVVPEEIRLYSAILLYKRGSRFLGFEEWQPYKNRVLDYILEEQANTPTKPYAPNVFSDVAGRLHKRLSTAVEEHLVSHDNRLDTHYTRLENIDTHLGGVLGKIHNVHNWLTEELIRTRKTAAILLLISVAEGLAGLTAIVYHFVK